MWQSFSGKEGVEGLESSGKDASHISRPAGAKASRRYSEVHAGTCSGSSPSSSTVCQGLTRRPGCPEAGGWTMLPSGSHQASWGVRIFHNLLISWSLMMHAIIVSRKCPIILSMKWSLFRFRNFRQQGWCDSPGTVTEVRAKLHNRQRGAIKRERAIVYSQSQQVILIHRNEVWLWLIGSFGLSLW